MNVETLSRAELLTLLSILEGELEAQDVVIHALRVSPRGPLAQLAQLQTHITTCTKNVRRWGGGCVNRKLRKQQGSRDKAGLESRPLTTLQVSTSRVWPPFRTGLDQSIGTRDSNQDISGPISLVLALEGRTGPTGWPLGHCGL